MVRIIHDITSLKFRDPAGAQPVGSSIKLTLLVEADAAFHPVMHLRFDKDSKEQVLRMTPTDPAPGQLYLAYRLTFTPKE